MFNVLLSRRAEGHLKVIEDLYREMLTAVDRAQVIKAYKALVRELKNSLRTGYITREAYDFAIDRVEDGLSYSLNLCIF